MDALSDVLRAVKLTGAVFLDAEFGAPWCVSADGAVLRRHMPEAEHFVNYHYIAGGRCQVVVDGGSTAEAVAGDVVVVAHGNPHLMSSAPLLAATPMDTLLQPPPSGGLARLRFGGSGETTHVVCGFLACDPRLCRPILSSLPRLIRVNIRQGPSGHWLEGSIRHSVEEALSARAGAAVVLARLGEVLFVETLRQYIEELPASQTGWLAGIRDPIVGRVLALIHSRAADDWTVDALAQSAGCSRSALAERFTHFLGQPPMHYLARWRLALAASALRVAGARVGRVAQEVGYASDTAFNRAFKREYGVAPSRWRTDSRPRQAETIADVHAAGG